MRYLAQALVIGVIALFTVAVFAPEWLTPQGTVPQTKSGKATSDDRLPAVSEGQSDETVANVSSQDGVDTSSPAARTKLVQSLKSAAQVIDEKIPGNDVSVTSQIVDTLDQADRILAEAQVANRQTLANVNRQVRLPGRSPQLLVVVVPGLHRDHFEEMDPNALPGLNRLQKEGTLIVGLRSMRTSVTASLQTIAYARSIDVASETIPPSLMSMLWHSGYETTLVGDLSWTASTEPGEVVRHGIEQSFGLKTAAEVAEAFPKHVWSNNVRVRVPANEAAEQVSADYLFVNETMLKLAGNAQSHRPQAVMLVLPELKGNDAATRSNELLASLLQKLDGKRLSERTLLVVIGLPSQTDVAEQPVALVRWSRNIVGGQEIDQGCDAIDLTPTILELTQSRRVSKWWPGKSRAEAWRSNTSPASDTKTGGALPEA